MTANQKPDISPFRAMIIEDHAFQRVIGVHVLKICGATSVLEAPSGAAALALLESTSEPIHIIVCDLNMPDMDGLEFLRHLGQRGKSGSVILASGMDADTLRSAEQTARTYGVNIIGTIEKPLADHKLLPVIARHFETA